MIIKSFGWVYLLSLSDINVYAETKSQKIFENITHKIPSYIDISNKVWQLTYCNQSSLLKQFHNTSLKTLIFPIIHICNNVRAQDCKSLQ